MSQTPSTPPDRTIKLLLSLIAVALTVIALRPLITPPPAYAGGAAIAVPDLRADGITAISNVGTGHSSTDIAAAFVRYKDNVVIITNRGGKWDVVKSIPLDLR